MENEKGEIVDLYVCPESCSFDPWRGKTVAARIQQYGLPNCLPIRHGNWEDSSYADICYDGSAMTGTLRPPQISIGKVDENGRLTDERQVYALCGFIRARGESDDSLNRLAQRDGLLKNVWSAQR
ncbi:hypothetical protein DTO212C5_5225 [Paecilomyces variotii]|nr:hypothetical protein DTO212C5_5225 [Paecilomyces variotii]